MLWRLSEPLGRKARVEALFLQLVAEQGDNDEDASRETFSVGGLLTASPWCYGEP